MAFPRYVSFHDNSNDLTVETSFCNVNSWTISPQYVSFHDTFNDLTEKMSSQIVSNWMTFHQYEFFHEILKVVKKQFFVTMLAAEVLLTSMSLLMKL